MCIAAATLGCMGARNAVAMPFLPHLTARHLLGLGYLVGPTIGSQAWRLSHRARLPFIDAKERELHRRIVAYRVDPVMTSATNPRLPDFYGEKIGSLSEYRQWLRDQAKYKRKAFWEEEP